MKEELRKKALSIRKNLPVEQYSSIIMHKLFSLPEYSKSKNILSYYPLKSEVNTLKCLEDKTKNWYLPRVINETLEFCPYESSNLKKGSFNIFEPCSSKIDDFSNIDMIIIPAVAADKNGYRLGYGKGFYDRFLYSLKSSPVKVILIFHDLLFETIYPEKHDIKGDIIITNKEIFRIIC